MSAHNSADISAYLHKMERAYEELANTDTTAATSLLSDILFIAMNTEIIDHEWFDDIMNEEKALKYIDKILPYIPRLERCADGIADSVHTVQPDKSKTPLKKVTYPCLVQMKENGVRFTVVSNGHNVMVMSRTNHINAGFTQLLNSISIPQSFVIDGELMLDTGLEQIAGFFGKMRKMDVSENLRLTGSKTAVANKPYHDKLWSMRVKVFAVTVDGVVKSDPDTLNEYCVFMSSVFRKAMLMYFGLPLRHNVFEPVDHIYTKSLSELQTILDSLNPDAEGVVIRDTKGYCVKWKQCYDNYEGVVVDITTPTVGKEIGSAILHIIAPAEFNYSRFMCCMAGLKSLRQDVYANRQYYIGKQVHFKCMKGTGSVPIQPTGAIFVEDGREYAIPRDVIASAISNETRNFVIANATEADKIDDVAYEVVVGLTNATCPP